MKRWGLILVAFIAASVLFFAPIGCGDDDDDDDESETSYGQDIEGTFSVNMQILEDTCNEDQVGYEEPWIIEIEQTANLAWGTVYWKQEGVGSQNSELFKAKVYGRVIMDAVIDEDPIGSSDCVKFTAKNYYIEVDLDTGSLEGRLTDNIFYQGLGCDTSMSDCRQERVLAPE